MAKNKKNNSLGDIASTLKNTIVGTKTTQIDQQLDDAVKDITSFRSNISQQNYIEMIRSYISHYQSNGMDSSLFSQHGDSSPSALGQGQRLRRYKLYDSIVSNITYCKRALNVLVDNILAPDDISKESIEVKPESYLEDQDQTESRIKQVRTIIDKLKIESSLGLIVTNTLQYGDYFCEIADNKTALTSRSFLVESELLTNSYNNENKSKAYQGQNITVTINYDYLFEKKSKNGNNKKNKKKDEEEDVHQVSQLNLVLHNPDRVVKLQSDLYPICFGYLIFPRYSGHGQFGSYREEQPIDDICAGIMRDLQSKIPQASELQNDEELKDIINTMVSQSNTNVMNIRYVPPNRMTHFNVPSSKFHPYGESIFDPVQFDAKVLMAMQSALAIQRLNKSTEKRKIGIELGLPRDASKQIQELKETFRKRKVSLDNFETLDTISSSISTFEDVYVPQKDGTPYVDIQNMDAGTVDTRSKVDELKFLRDSIITALNVPPAFLGIEENLCIPLDSLIKLVDDRELTLNQIIQEYKQGIENEVYSYDHETGMIVPGKITWAGETRQNAQLVRVHLDNGEYEDCTPDHPWMLRDGTYKEAKDLEPNDSLMPLYLQDYGSKTINGGKYKRVYHPGIDIWDMVHKSFYEYKYGPSDDNHIHHIDLNNRNNADYNLIRLTPKDHLILHGRLHRKDNQELIDRMIKDKSEVKNIINQSPYELKPCSICGKYFYFDKNVNVETCSDECSIQLKREYGYKSWNVRKNDFEEVCKYCPICGDEIRLNKLPETKLRESLISCDKESCKNRIRSWSNLTKKGTKLSCEIEYRNCLECGSLFIYNEDKVKKKDIKLTNICSSVYCRNKVLLKRRWDKHQDRIQKECRFCGDEFELPKSQLNQIKNEPTCGKEECYRKGMREINNIRYLNNKVNTICSACGKEVTINRGYYNQVSFITCGESSCKNKIKRIPRKTNEDIGCRPKVMNHKVAKVEWLKENKNTGDITVEGYHNFALNSGVIVHNSQKATLSEENALFARTVVGYQKFLSDQIGDLIYKCYYLTNPDDALTLFDNVSIALPVPRNMAFERESKAINDAVNVVEALERIDVPKEWAKKKFLTNIDWDEVENFEVDTEIDKNLGEEDEDEEEGGGGMGF